MADNSPSTGTNRLVSLDAFRGITIAGMLVVNNPGTWSAVYGPLEHAEWHGWTPTDLIFPFFLFIVGVAMAFSFPKRIERGARRRDLFRHVAIRSAILFALGMVLTGIPDFNYDKKLILDVLQRIAVVYCISAALVLIFDRKLQLLLAFLFLAFYWVLMVFVSVPGYGRGVLEWEGSVWAYVDDLILEGWHSHAEGILSLIPSFSTVLLGSVAGEWLRKERTHMEKIVMMFVAGNAGLVLGLILDAWFPINKLLWSPSYVIFTTGFALSLLAMCYWAIEVRGWKRWARPFLVFGMNPLSTFFLASLLGRLMGLITFERVGTDGAMTAVGLKTIIFQSLFASWLSDINASLLYALVYTTVWLGIMSIFYRKRLFLRV